jgi:SAM-dependent methyltransferase
MSDIDEKTIADFDQQWTIYADNDGWYGSVELFEDIISPLLTCDDLRERRVAEIGSGTGRIVNMLLEAGAAHVCAVEPAPGAFQNLQKNLRESSEQGKVKFINARGDNWLAEPAVDYVFSIGVIQFISEPGDTIKCAYENLKPGGEFFIWLYSYEGNEAYLAVILPLRKLTSKLPHFALRLVVELIYGAAFLYRQLARIVPLPLRQYIDKIWWPMTPAKRRLVIYDQLNPSYAKYYRRQEAIDLMKDGGFVDIKIHHRYGYSWCVKGVRPVGSK